MPQDRRFTSSFPDIKTAPGGRFGGVLMGLQTMQKQGNVNRKFGMLREELAVSKQKNIADMYNKYTDREWKNYQQESNRINRYNIAETKAAGKENKPNLQPLPPKPDVLSYADFIRSMTGGGGIMGGGGIKDAMPDVAPKEWPGGAPSPYDVGKGVTGAGAGARGGGGMMGAVPGLLQTASQARPSNLAFQAGAGAGQNIAQQLQQLLGQPQGGGAQRAQGGAQAPVGAQAGGAGEGPTTEDVLTALDDYESNEVDRVIADILELDKLYNQTGFDLGANIDNEVVLEAFRRKFGDEAVRRLQSMVQ